MAASRTKRGIVSGCAGCGAATVNAIIELLKQTKGTVFVNEDGIDDLFQFVARLD